jgi:putative acetyltransferase
MRASIRGLARASYTPRELAAWSSLPALYHAWAMTAGGERYVVAEQDGRLVGYAAWRGRELTALFVLPARARTGVGGALLARVERDARRAGARSIFTRAALSGAAFYRAHGFSGARRIHVALAGRETLTAVRLGKPLRPPRSSRPR